MAIQDTPRRYPRLLALLLALSASLWFTPARAATPQISVHSDQTALCTSNRRVAPAIDQDGVLDLSVQGFLGNMEFELQLIFPDGRRYSPEAAQRPVGTAGALNGLEDLIADPMPVYLTDSAGESYLTFYPNTLWPPGCYVLRAISYANSASTSFVVRDPALVANPGPAKLTVREIFSSQPRAEQGSQVSISGTGFQGGEYIHIVIVQPNKTLLEPFQDFTTPAGSFQVNYIFGITHRTGVYTFVAEGLSSGYRVSGHFQLTPAPLFQNGPAVLKVSVPYPATISQNQNFQVIGRRYTPNNQATVLFIAPAGTIYNGGGTMTNANGDFDLPSSLSVQLPTGLYSVVAFDNGPRIAKTTLRLQAAP